MCPFWTFVYFRKVKWCSAVYELSSGKVFKSFQFSSQLNRVPK